MLAGCSMFFSSTQNKTKALSGHSTLSFFHNTLIVVENIEWLLDILPLQCMNPREKHRASTQFFPCEEHS
jgi:hypothetical protein